jgi:hypothetical protein
VSTILVPVLLKENSVAESTRQTTFDYFHLGCDILYCLQNKYYIQLFYINKELTVDSSAFVSNNKKRNTI